MNTDHLWYVHTNNQRIRTPKVLSFSFFCVIGKAKIQFHVRTVFRSIYVIQLLLFFYPVFQILSTVFFLTDFLMNGNMCCFWCAQNVVEQQIGNLCNMLSSLLHHVYGNDRIIIGNENNTNKMHTTKKHSISTELKQVLHTQKIVLLV